MDSSTEVLALSRATCSRAGCPCPCCAELLHWEFRCLEAPEQSPDAYTKLAVKLAQQRGSWGPSTPVIQASAPK